MDEKVKRLFLGFNAEAPWPEKMPQGRIIEEKDRHFTFAFLGNQEVERMMSIFPYFPKPTFKVGLAGYFDACLKFPHVIAWRANFGKKTQDFHQFHDKIAEWLNIHGFSLPNKKKFIPHVSICRHPLEVKEWKKAFHQIPVLTSSLSLYQSLRFSKYQRLWEFALPVPFEEISHTADLAFRVRAESLEELFWNAAMALSFYFPELLKYYKFNRVNHLDDIIIELNQALSEADSDLGAPFKAVSFHGDIQEKDTFLEWEMIVDV